MNCPSCGGNDHQRSNAKLCKKRKIPLQDIPPAKEADPSRNYLEAPYGLFPITRSFKSGLKTALRKDTDSLYISINEYVDHFTRLGFEISRFLQIHLQRIIL